MVVKICGLVRPDDAAWAVRAGADWLGLNFWPRSKRFVSPSAAREVAAAAREARSDIELVGVFVNEDPSRVRKVAEDLGLAHVQLHGDESPEVVAGFGERAIKAMALSGEADLERMAAYDCPLVLVDTPSAGRGGSGEVGDWDLARRAAASRRVLLAGGLTPDNVRAAVVAVQPFGIDVASGVESSPGVKDASKVQRFVAAVRAAPIRC